MSEETPTILPTSSMDRRLLRAKARYATPQELSEAVLGKLTPAQAEDRVLHLLESKSSLDEVKERRLLLVQMAEHLDWMKSQRDNEKSWSAIAKMYKLVSDQIERSNVNLTDISSKLGNDHARYFIDAFTVGFEKMLKVAAEEHGIEIEEEVILSLMDAGVKASQEHVDMVTLKEIE